MSTNGDDYTLPIDAVERGEATMTIAEELATFAAQVFRDAFADDNTTADMDLYCRQAFSPAIQQAELADPGMETLLMRDGDGRLTAYAQLRFGPVPEEVSGPDPIELVRFYVRRDRHGCGEATRLMGAVLAAAERRGASTMWLGVWERNPRARRFYEKQGFHDVGAHDFLVGHDRQTDRLMVRALTRQ